MKFYVHCEAQNFTMVILWEEGRRGVIQDALSIFCKTLNEKQHGIPVKEENAEVYSSKGIKLSLSLDISSQVKHMDDLFVTFSSPSETSMESVTKNLESPDLQDAEDRFKDIKISCMEDSGLVQDEKRFIGDRSQAIQRMTSQAIIYIGNQKYQAAVMLYNQILELDPNNQASYLGLVSCYMKAGRAEKALEFALKGQKKSPGSLELLLVLGECYIALGNGDKAVEALLKYCKLMRQSGRTNTEHKQDVNVLLAKGYLLKDQKDMAITVLQGVLRENDSHTEALAEYSSLIFPLGSECAEKAVTVLLALLATHRSDKNIKEKFAHVCSLPGGMEMLEHVAGPAWQDTAALTFMATSLRDCGAIVHAIQLMRRAHEVDRSNSHVLLTLVHMLELVCGYEEGILLIKEYVTCHPGMQIGQTKCGVLIPVLKDTCGPVCPTYDEGETNAGAQIERKGSDEQEKYLLASVFTLVKLLYITGKLRVIPPVMEILEPCYQGRELHKTDIRNEAAYFQCINEVFSAWTSLSGQPGPVTRGDNPTEKCIYLLGDSHCLPAAWQSVSIKDEEYTVYPILSTGTKIWHLRPESKFYPTFNFNSVIKLIPDGATVIVCFGEIDCREAFLACWEKARYETVEDAMETVIKLYLQVLKKLQKANNWVIYIHPVLPVLEITWPIVMEFNKRLAARIAEDGTFHWLDIVPGLISPDGSSLREEYKLDGTHVHPRYKRLLEKCMQGLSS